MKITITLQSNDGTTYEGAVELKPRLQTSAKRIGSKKKAVAPTASTAFDFTLPLRAFMTAHGARRLSGPQKFTLLVAALVKGDATVTVTNERIQKEWNRMTEPMGGRYNAAYSTRAKDKAWVESPKPGVYKLRKNWSEAVPS